MINQLNKESIKNHNKTQVHFIRTRIGQLVKVNPAQGKRNPNKAETSFSTRDSTPRKRALSTKFSKSKTTMINPVTKRIRPCWKLRLSKIRINTKSLNHKRHQQTLKKSVFRSTYQQHQYHNRMHPHNKVNKQAVHPYQLNYNKRPPNHQKYNRQYNSNQNQSPASNCKEWNKNFNKAFSDKLIKH